MHCKRIATHIHTYSYDVVVLPQPVCSDLDNANQEWTASEATVRRESARPLCPSPIVSFLLSPTGTLLLTHSVQAPIVLKSIGCVCVDVSMYMGEYTDHFSLCQVRSKANISDTNRPLLLVQARPELAPSNWRGSIRLSGVAFP